MDNQTGARRRPRRGWPLAARVAAAIIATAGLSALAAACGGSTGGHVAQLGSTSTTSSSASNVAAASTQQRGALAFSRCMRSHGVLSFPDPGSGGGIPKIALQRLGVSLSRFQAAQQACRHLLPNGGSGPSQAQLQQSRSQALRFSRCVRAHGVPSFPDPDSSGRIPDPATLRPPINQGSPLFQAANRACGRYRPPYMPSNAAYDAYAQANGTS